MFAAILTVVLFLFAMILLLLFLAFMVKRNRTRLDSEQRQPAYRRETFRRLFGGGGVRRRFPGPGEEGEEGRTTIAAHNSLGTLLQYDAEGTHVVDTRPLALLEEDGDFILITRALSPIVEEIRHNSQCRQIIPVPKEVGGIVRNTVSSPHIAIVRQNGELFLSELRDYPSTNKTRVLEDGRWNLFSKRPLDSLFGKTIHLGDHKILLLAPVIPGSGDTGKNAAPAHESIQFF